MARLTPLSKGLIGLAVIGGVVSVVWNLGLKETMNQTANPTSPATAPAAAPIAVTPPAPGPVPVAAPVAVPPAPTSEPAVPAPAGKAISAAESGEKGRQYLDAGDYARARIYLEQAVKMGDGPAACHLGEMTLKGQGGIAANQEKSAELFRLAQARGMICFASGN